ncbi:hypothetical protein IMZ48_21070 [Candidatus Bathyarchaeota archaeon]|nr:hypothetical protein [Candidatus Bathyarchaeota archaeon]
MDADPEQQELSDGESDLGDTDPAPESLSWDTLWAEAHGILRDDPEHTDLLATFEKYVVDGKDVGSDGADNPPL